MEGRLVGCELDGDNEGCEEGRTEGEVEGCALEGNSHCARICRVLDVPSQGSPPKKVFSMEKESEVDMHG